MLDAAGRTTVGGLDDVVVFPDTSVVGGFYAVSTTPRVVREPDGKASLGLTVYGRRTAGAFTASGGILTLTTELAVSDDRLARIRSLLAAQLAQGWPADSKEPPPSPQLLAPDWLEGSVQVRLTDELTLTGSPSMSSDNRCSFSSKLTDSGASALARLWRDGLPDATITYTGRLRSGSSAVGGSASTTSTTGSSTTKSTTSHSSTSTSSSSSHSWSSSSSSSSSGGPGEVITRSTHSSSEPDGTTTYQSRTAYASSSDFGCGDGDDPDPVPEPPVGNPSEAPKPGWPGIAVGEPHSPRADSDLITASAALADSVPDLMDYLIFVEL